MSAPRRTAAVAGVAALVIAGVVTAIELDAQGPAGALRTSSVFWLLGGVLLLIASARSPR